MRSRPDEENPAWRLGLRRGETGVAGGANGGWTYPGVSFGETGLRGALRRLSISYLTAGRIRPGWFRPCGEVRPGALRAAEERFGRCRRHARFQFRRRLRR